MSSRLESLPPELLFHALSYLPIRSLLTLSQTSHNLHRLSQTALTTIHLAIFPRKLHSVLAFLDAPLSIQYDVDHHAITTLPQTYLSRPGRPICRGAKHRYKDELAPPERLEATISNSNKLALEILGPYSDHLRTLSLMLWDPAAELLSFIASSLPSLRTLNLHLSHPTHRDIALPAFYFDPLPKPSAIWNSISGLGEANQQRLRLHGLETLSIERAGITSAQLRGLVASNPCLGELRLKCVRGVSAEFVNWLGEHARAEKGRLEILHLEDCQDLSLRLNKDAYEDEQRAEFEWITHLVDAGLQELGVFRCEEVELDVLRKMNREVWQLRNLDCGYEELEGETDGGNSSSPSDGNVLEVDPECL